MHPFYLINVSESVFLGNHISNSSGPLLKLRDQAGWDSTGHVVASTLTTGRKFFIDNDFYQATLYDQNYPANTYHLAMIHDNSVDYDISYKYVKRSSQITDTKHCFQGEIFGGRMCRWTSFAVKP